METRRPEQGRADQGLERMTLARVMPSIYDPAGDEVLTTYFEEVEPGLFARRYTWAPGWLAFTPAGAFANSVPVPDPIPAQSL